MRETDKAGGNGYYWVKMYGKKSVWRVAYLKFEYEGSFFFVGLIGESKWCYGLDIKELGPKIEKPEMATV